MLRGIYLKFLKRKEKPSLPKHPVGDYCWYAWSQSFIVKTKVPFLYGCTAEQYAKSLFVYIDPLGSINHE
jgi:hypothetical protein